MGDCYQCHHSVNTAAKFCGNCGSPVSLSSPSSSIPSISHQGSNCPSCGGKIAGGSIAKALGKEWHSECFVCTSCRGDLSKGFLEKEGKVYCEKDFRRLFQPAENCNRCGKTIVVPPRGVADGKGGSYHLGCFTCAFCSQLLSTDFFWSGNQVACKQCHQSKKNSRSTQSSCKECTKSITTSQFVEEDGYTFHSNCYSKYLRKKM